MSNVRPQRQHRIVAMQIAQVGPWQFEMPDGWELKDNESSNSYFEDSDGSKGLYVKAIELSEPKAASKQVAEYIQDVHLRGFTEATKNTWKVVDHRASSKDNLTRSVLDLYDAKANYRVLSLVICNTQSALQVTVHDYWCEHYSASRFSFAQVESSMSRVSSAA